MTPMLRQYFRLKEENPGCVLFFRCGDFYETYGDDAELASRELEIAKTSKDAGSGQKVAMAGVPFFCVDSYIYALVSKGYKVALADQMEDPKQAKGLVKREVVKILTAGTITEPQVLDSGKNNFLGATYARNSQTFASFCDISTGDFFVVETNPENLADEIEKWAPAELLLDPSLASSQDILNRLAACEIQYSFIDEFPSEKESLDQLNKYYGFNQISSLDISKKSGSIICCGTILSYVLATQKNAVITLKKPQLYSNKDFASVDAVSKKNLELLETMAGREKKGTLLWAIDASGTAMGKRTLRTWITRPLIIKEQIEERLKAVEALILSYDKLQKLTGTLKNIQDLERLISKAVIGSANPRDLLTLGQSLTETPKISLILKSFDAPLLQKLSDMQNLQELGEHIITSLIDNPPASLRDGGIFKDGFSKELDELRTIRREGRSFIASIEERERVRTGIKNLKIGFNQVAGYYIEISKGNAKYAPSDYMRKQTLANAERYINKELKDYEAKVLGAEERIKSLEYELFNNLRLEAVAHFAAIQDMAAKIGAADVLAGFAFISAQYNYVKPTITEEPILEIINGRHPVVERILNSSFIQNDAVLNSEQRLAIITGPNMSGKSTYLRQNALIALMAQIGCYVPAEKAVVGIVDKFFTRVGATDDLHLGQSTFMMEMLETANILNNATQNSLVILDEIGRGTSTYDGMSIAYAVCEFLYSKIKARTFFATHFHELTSLSEIFKGIINKKVAVKERGGEVVFLHKILDGASDKSYGIYVASLAGFPKDVIEKAKKILEELEKEKTGFSEKIITDDDRILKNTQNKETPAKRIQLTFFDSNTNSVADEIRRLNLTEITPIEALNKIYKWQSELNSF